MKSCTKQEFDAFLAQYPRKLERGVSRMYDPPLVTYNDFTLGKWPASVVASHSFENLEATIPGGWRIAG